MKIKIVFIVFLFFYSCSKNKSTNISKAEVKIIYHKDIIDDKKDSTLIDDVEYIPLSTTGESIIGQINRMLYEDDKFYLFDFMVTRSVFVFDKSGNFLYKINNTGGGPGQYISLSDFEVDTNGNIFVFDAGGTRKIIKYTNNGNNFELIQPKKSFMEFKFINNDKFVVYLPFSEVGIEDCYGIIDIRRDTYKSLIEKRIEIDDDQNFFELSHIFRSNQTVYISPRYSNQIYKITDDKFSLEFEFEKELMPDESFIEEIIANSQIFYRNNKFVSSIKGVYETENSIILSFRHYTDITLIVDKKSKNTRLLSNLENCKFLSSNSILGSTGEKFFSVVWGFDSDDIRESCLPPDKKSKLLNLPMDSNPVIVLFKIKEF